VIAKAISVQIISPGTGLTRASVVEATMFVRLGPR
jgi:hypothetical protein